MICVHTKAVDTYIGHRLRVVGMNLLEDGLSGHARVW